ncbi:MAG: hypothetical protein ACRDJ4_03530 [Actinomycetota bacterium]
MAESPDEVFERVLKEEHEKGVSPAVAQSRAKAARVRASKGLPTDAAAAARAAAGAKPAGDGGAAEPAAESKAQPAAASGEDPEAAFERVLKEEHEKGSSPAVAQARAKAARMRAQKGASTAPTPARQPAAAEARPAPAASAGGGAQAAAAAPRGRGAAVRAARSGAEGVPERIQRLLAVVKPEAIQRVEREPIDRVNTWPHLMAAEFLALLAVTVFLMIFSFLVPATFREMANINQTPNPSKAPWYFLGLQELLRYFHPQVAGVTIPQWIILGLVAAPFIDRNPSNKPADRKLAIVLFTIFLLFFAVLVTVGSIFRGPGFNWIYPWEIPVEEIFEL